MIPISPVSSSWSASSFQIDIIEELQLPKNVSWKHKQVKLLVWSKLRSQKSTFYILVFIPINDMQWDQMFCNLLRLNWRSKSCHQTWWFFQIHLHLLQTHHVCPMMTKLYDSLPPFGFIPFACDHRKSHKSLNELLLLSKDKRAVVPYFSNAMHWIP